MKDLSKYIFEKFKFSKDIESNKTLDKFIDAVTNIIDIPEDNYYPRNIPYTITKSEEKGMDLIIKFDTSEVNMLDNEFRDGIKHLKKELEHIEYLTNYSIESDIWSKTIQIKDIEFESE